MASSREFTMRETYHEKLDAISQELVQMTVLVGSAISKATRALLDADLQLAESVIEGDETVDMMAADIDEQCYELAALQQPVATDLRIVMTGIQISMSMERMGDLARHVARQTRLRYPKSSVPQELRGTFAQMGAVAEAIVGLTGSIISTKDVSLAIDIERSDDLMDELHASLFRRVLSESWPYGVEEAIDVTLLSRFYERFADHAVTIAKRVIHIVTGEPYAAVSVVGPGVPDDGKD
ncbi:MAG: phosphate signaling complex protein PhoU [Candidatus Nanopelagicales bacterium]|nr:phosphate signaling complex protein PhoU [Candidatus Nanopelagicales bacterium]